MKTKNQLSAALVVVIMLSSCGESKNSENSNPETADVELIENGQKFSFENHVQVSDSSSNEELENSIFGKKPDFKNEELPKTYTLRKVIKNIAALSYDIYYLPGNIVKFNEADSNYILVTAKSILKKSALPNVQSLTDEVLYSNKINNKASFNASALIGGLSVGKEELMELVIQDVSKSIATDSLIDVPTLKNIIKKIPKEKRKNYYFIKSSLLTLVNFKKYSSANFSTKVNTSYVTAGGEVYSSKDKFSKERVVSLDLISLDDLLEQAPH